MTNISKCFAVFLFLTVAYSCNKGLEHLHSNVPLNYTQVYEYPILLFNGYGGKEVIINGNYFNFSEDSIFLNNNDYSIVSFKLTIYTRVQSEKNPRVFNIIGNQITGEAHKFLFGYHTFKFCFSDVWVKDKYGQHTRPLYKKTTFYTMNL